MAEIYRVIHPIKYFNDCVSQKLRPDGRRFHDIRSIKLNVGSVSTADASAIVKYGNTTIVCGIQLELATPKAEEPNFGYIVTNVELPSLCSSKYRPGPPSDHAQITSNMVSEIITNSKCIDLKDLCIVPDKLSWVLYCDMVCLDNDGSLVDACVTALVASLKTITLPDVQYDSETEDIFVSTNKRTALKIYGMPAATSFTLYNSDIILADPSAYEENLCGGPGANFIVCWNNGVLHAVQKFGGSNISLALQQKAFNIAEKKATLVEQLINKCLL